MCVCGEGRGVETGKRGRKVQEGKRGEARGGSLTLGVRTFFFWLFGLWAGLNRFARGAGGTARGICGTAGLTFRRRCHP